MDKFYVVPMFDLLQLFGLMVYSMIDINVMLKWFFLYATFWNDFFFFFACNIYMMIIDIEILVGLRICVVENLICKYSLMNEMLLWDEWMFVITIIGFEMLWLIWDEWIFLITLKPRGWFICVFAPKECSRSTRREIDVRVLKWSVL
jgi:hypothetical protein